MKYRKIILLLLSSLSVLLTIYVHGAYIIPVLIFLHLLFNETDFLLNEKPEYIESDLSKLLDPEAGPVEILKGSKKAIIFVHGFPSTPATFKFVIPEAEERGYDVFAPLLPGFGTDKDEFLKTNFTQWYAYLRDFYLDKRKKYEKVYLVGLSLGGALTLKLSEEFSQTESAPDAVSLVSAPVFTNSLVYGFYKNYLLYFVRPLGWFVKFIDRKSESWKKMEDDHNQWLGYSGLFPVQSFSIKIAIEKIRSDLKRITIPVIAFHAPGDRTVQYKNFHYIEKKISSEQRRFQTVDYSGWYNTQHILLLYASVREMLIHNILDFFEEVHS
jgi:carboxylesterase